MTIYHRKLLFIAKSNFTRFHEPLFQSISALNYIHAPPFFWPGNNSIGWMGYRDKLGSKSLLTNSIALYHNLKFLANYVQPHGFSKKKCSTTWLKCSDFIVHTIEIWNPNLEPQEYVAFTLFVSSSYYYIFVIILFYFWKR